jgi:3-hydroxy-9,10-secoandrosta-1,3,5(10)-triene-9,17-dione monooxygenase
MLARAASLVPALGERAPDAEKLRRIPDQTLRDFHDSGLLRMVQPRRVGGAELDFTILVDVCAEVARGCASSSWVLGNLASHHWMLGMWPAQAQEEIWGVSPDTLVGSALVFPAGRALKVDGGYRLHGHWPYSSGIDPCAWTMVGGLVDDADTDAHEYRIFLLPRADYEIIDTWFVSGLAGTGSKDVEAKDVFVPEHRTLSVDQTKGGEHPGAQVNPGPLFRIPLFATFPYLLSGVSLGIAQAAVERFASSTHTRITNYSGRNAADFPTVQIRLAEAAACVDTARLLMRSNCNDAQAIAERGQIPDLMTKVKYRRDGAFASDLCVRAVDTLFIASGGAGLFDSNPIQRSFRDIHAAAAHISLTWDVAAAIYGRTALGLSPDAPTL